MGVAGRPERRRASRSRAALDAFRRNPIRNGLVGLAVAGTAAPIAVNQFQQALRTDPSHERFSLWSAGSAGQVSDDSVARAWGDMESADAARTAQRASTIESKLDQYSAYGLSPRLAGRIYDLAEQAGLDPDVAFGLVRAESSFRSSATSSVGAIGLTQLMPRTARWLSPGTTVRDLRDPETNLRIGFTYLSRLIDRYDGDTHLALLAYNRGPSTVDRVLQRGGNPDNGYVDRVLAR